MYMKFSGSEKKNDIFSYRIYFFFPKKNLPLLVPTIIRQEIKQKKKKKKRNQVDLYSFHTDK